MQSQFIKVNVKFYVFCIVTIGCLFLTLCILEHKKAAKYLPVTKDEEIKLISITGREHFGVLRGAVFIEMNKFISSSAPLITNHCQDEIWESHGPIVDFNNEPHHYTLDDLAYPYSLYKKINSDTIYVVKEKCLLQFKLQ